MFETRDEDVLKGGDFWTKEIERAGLKDKLLPFNDILVGDEAGNGEPMVRDAVLDGIKVDIYHSDENNKSGIKGGRIYIHRKERVSG